MTPSREKRNEQSKDRRSVERRAAKRGVTIRHDDTDGHVPKRIRRAAKRKDGSS